MNTHEEIVASKNVRSFFRVHFHHHSRTGDRVMGQSKIHGKDYNMLKKWE